ncbi:hypothetical protein CPB83DRAFT_860391 [Crepidotus variabilis]|uniref:Uncharacterized protein n=1 Tax=Crepidotus variabilis TaxID=179855 RepID=A0A9P6JLT8_9AGAR|nr:hypothetical protein CPB83DRAFT_860391 [Crepidotus variabilis]
MFGNFTSRLTNSNSSTEKKVLSPTLRPDIYSLVDQTKIWLLSDSTAGQPGDGVTYGPLLTVIQKHIPSVKKPGLEAFGQVEGEVAVIVGGITSMILELSRWEGLSSGMAMRTWVDGLVDAHSKATTATRKDAIAKGITHGLNRFTDASLLTKDFTTRIQVISCLKTVSSRIYGAGTEEARQSEAMWSSKFI